MAKIKMKDITEIAKNLKLEENTLLYDALEVFLMKELRKIQAEIYRICGKYAVENSSEIDEKYKKGELEEKDSWEDYFKLDHLEYKRKQILNALEKINANN